jgi:hypothetical protein
MNSISESPEVVEQQPQFPAFENDLGVPFLRRPRGNVWLAREFLRAEVKVEDQLLPVTGIGFWRSV